MQFKFPGLLPIWENRIELTDLTSLRELTISKHKISFLLPSLRGGGAQRVMLNIASALSQRNHDIELILVNKEGELSNRIPRSIKVVDLASNGALVSIPVLFLYFRKHKPQLIFSSLPHISLLAIIVKILACTKTKIVIVEHNTLSQSVRFANSLKDRCLPILMRIIYPLAARIVAVSTGVANDLSRVIGIPRSRIHVIFNPVVTPELLTSSFESEEHPWFEHGQPPVILGIGRLTQAKGFSNLIYAFSRIRKNQIRARLMILGEGDERSNLEALISTLGVESEVSLPGFHDNPYFFLRNSSVFVLSSLWEGLPTVLIEALACGVAIVSTNCPSGPDEILENGKWGTLVPVNDETALVTAIQNTLTTTHKPIPEVAWARFGQEEVTNKYLQLISSITHSEVS